MMSVRCGDCRGPMRGVQAECACSFWCDCKGGGQEPARSPMAGSMFASGQRWCRICAPEVADDEPTLVEGPVLDFADETTRAA